MNKKKRAVETEVDNLALVISQPVIQSATQSATDGSGWERSE